MSDLDDMVNEVKAQWFRWAETWKHPCADLTREEWLEKAEAAQREPPALKSFPAEDTDIADTGKDEKWQIWTKKDPES